MALFVKLLFVLVVCDAEVKAVGLAVIKEQVFHDDRLAKPFRFEKITILPNHYRFEIKDSKPFTMEKSRRVEWITLLSRLPENIVKGSDLVPHEKSIEECRVFLQKYPQLKEYLAAYMELLENDIMQFNEGFVMHRKNWITRENFNAIKKGVEAASDKNQGKILIKIAGQPEHVIDGTIRDFKSVVITDFTPSKIVVRHNYGGLTIPFEEIPDAIKEILNLNESDARAHREEIAKSIKKDAAMNAAAAKKKKLLRNKKTFEAEVFQVLSGGVLLKNISYKLCYKEQVESSKRVKIGGGPTTLSPNRRSKHVTRKVTEWVFKTYRLGKDKLVYVECETDNYSDDGGFRRDVYPDGVYTYKNLLGAKKTVDKYITNEKEYLTLNGYRPYKTEVEQKTQVASNPQGVNQSHTSSDERGAPQSNEPDVLTDAFGEIALGDKPKQYVRSHRETQNLRIISATYGAGNIRKDVLAEVRTHIKNDRLKFSVGSGQLGGDPVWGKVKELRVKYEHDNQIREKFYREGAYVSIP